MSLPATSPTSATLHRFARASTGALLTLAIVAVLLLVPDATRVYATMPLGALRAPGEAAFIAGHRGDRSVAPENTLSALAAALSGPLEFVETDVQLTLDRVPVVIHDRTLDRTTDGTGSVANRTLAQLLPLDAGSWYGPQFAGERIPQLSQFLDLLVDARGKKAMIELKGDWSPDELQLVTAQIYLRGLQNRVVFAAFDPDTLHALRDTVSAIPRVVIRRALPKDPVGFVREVGAMAVLTSAKSMSGRAVDELHAAGLGVMVYTLNSEKRWTSALSLGVDGIITDVPSELDGWIAATAPGT